MTESPPLLALFDGWEETMVWACLQGVMGWGMVNESGTAGLIVNQDFSFLAGKPDRALAQKAPGPILVPRSPDWHPLIKDIYGSQAIEETRWAIRKEPDVFDRERLKRFVHALPAGYALRPIDEALVPILLKEKWSQDFCSAFDSPADFCCRGIGVAALHAGVPVAGAGSYSIYRGGIEIEIGTRADHRRKGLATACGAALILACLDRGLYPSWDAMDLRSAALAEKLGYHRGAPYPVYWIGRHPPVSESEEHSRPSRRREENP